jgi:hypothetical protein
MYPPLEWVEYLQRERGLGSVEGSLAVPLGGDCKDRLALLRRAFREINGLDEEARADTRDRKGAALDDLDPDALLETGPSPDDAQSVLWRGRAVSRRGEARDAAGSPRATEKFMNASGLVGVWSGRRTGDCAGACS